MRTAHPRLLLCLAASALAQALAPSSAAQRPDTFSESLVVREREIVVDLPDNVADDRLSPRDFRVLVDGQPREVTRVEPAGEAWTIVLYVDEVLAKPGTIFYSGLALANRARQLARAGSIEIAVADPDPRVVLPPTQDRRRIELALMDLSAVARVERDRSEGASRAASEPSILKIRRQLDKLLTFLAARHPPGPHAVLVLADGPDLPPEQAALVERQDPSAAAGTPAFVFHRSAGLLAAYGWVTIPVPLRKEGLGVEVAAQSETEIFRQGAAPSDHQNSVPPILPGRPPRKTVLSFPGVIDFLVEPKTAALRVLARATAGTVIGFEVQLDPTLEALSRRWRVWFTEPDAAVDGRLHRIAVSLPRKRKVARAPAWLRSSSPEGLAEARLEDLLAGQPPAGDLPFTASVQRAPSGLELRLALAPLRSPESGPSGPVRVSWAFAEEEGAAGVHHEMLPGAGLEKGLRYAERIVPPPAARRMAIVVEALGPERWAGAVLEIPPADGP